MSTDHPDQGPSPGPSRLTRPGHDLQLLTLAFARAAASRAQMTAAQYFRVALELLCRAPCRLLVIGAGRDTELYVRVSAAGRTVVLEHHPQWIGAVEHLACTVLPVAYQTRLKDGLVEPCPLPGGVPAWLLQASWDVILVDAPEGYGPDSPGHQQSIYLASLLAGPGTTIFLHDWERPMERQCAARYLREPDELLGERPALAIFRYSLTPARGEETAAAPGENLPAAPDLTQVAARPRAGPMAPPAAAPVPPASPSPRPRLLFCSYHCLLDPSSGAARSARDLLSLLAGRGWPCRVFCGPQLDFEAGVPLAQLLADQGLYWEARPSPAGAVPFTVYHAQDGEIPVTVYLPAQAPRGQPPGRAEGQAFLALLGRVLTREQPDLMLTYGGQWVASEAIACAKRHGARVVFWLRNFAYPAADPFRLVNGVLVPSHYAKEH